LIRIAISVEGFEPIARTQFLRRIWKPRAVGDRRGASALEATIAVRT
jgi:hypothetical protein